MSEGTSLDDIESGTIQNEADQVAMNAIMADMNATEPEMSSMPQHTMPMQHMQPMPMRDPIQERFTAQYEPVQSVQSVQSMQSMQSKPHPKGSLETPKKNGWSQIFDSLRDSLIVGLLVCFFSLPALHTWLGSRLSWAYKVGGSMSWIGFLLLFVVSAGSYTGYQTIVKKFGL